MNHCKHSLNWKNNKQSLSIHIFIDFNSLTYKNKLSLTKLTFLNSYITCIADSRQLKTDLYCFILDCIMTMCCTLVNKELISSKIGEK